MCAEHGSQAADADKDGSTDLATKVNIITQYLEGQKVLIQEYVMFASGLKQNYLASFIYKV